MLKQLLQACSMHHRRYQQYMAFRLSHSDLFYQRLETRFLRNLNERELAIEEADPLAIGVMKKNESIQSALKPWTADIIDMAVDPHAEYIGIPLAELACREKYGSNIVYIKRGDKLVHAPGRHNKLLPFDHVGIVATDEQMQTFKPVFEAVEHVNTTTRIEDIVLQKIVVDELNKLKGKTIRDSAIRELTNGIVLGLERDNTRILNPESTTKFEWGDIVWIVGDRKKIQMLKPGSKEQGRNSFEKS